MPTQANIENDCHKLKVLLEDTNNSVITFVLYRDASEQRENAAKLKDLLNVPVTEVALKGDDLNPVRTFLDLPKEPRQAIFYTFMGSSLPEGKSDFDKFAGYVNIQREAFEDAPHAVVLWLREGQLVRLMRNAPDFWAWRSGVFDVRGELEPSSPTYRELEEADAFDRESLEEQVALYREILKGQLERDKPDLAYVGRTGLRLADTLYKLGLYSEMSDEAEKTISVALILKDEKLRAAALNSLVLAHFELGHRDQAESLYREAVKLGKQYLGETHPEYVSGLNNLASLLKSKGDYEEAEGLYKEAIEIEERKPGSKTLKYATYTNNLADLFAKVGALDEAERLYKEALEVVKNLFGEEHPGYATSANNLANLYESRGLFEKAEEFYRKAIDINEKMLGKEHPNYAFGLQNLAITLQNVGRYSEAENLYKESLERLKEYLGEDHPQARAVQHNYTNFQVQKRRSELASTD